MLHLSVTLTVLAGIPGSGKSHWCNKQSAVIVSADALRLRRAQSNAHEVFAGMRSEVHAALRSGKEVIVDACALRKEDRIPWLRCAKSHRARTRLVIVDTPFELCKERNSVRAHRVDALQMLRYKQRMRSLSRECRSEPWDEIICVRSGRTKKLR